MTSFTTYTLLSLVWHPNSSERLHIGLWMNDSNRVMFNYSQQRLDIASKLINPSEFRLVRTVLQDLKQTFSVKKQTNNINLASEWGAGRMTYLQNYGTNLLQVENSIPISLELNTENFHFLCLRYLGIAKSAFEEKNPEMEARLKKFITSNLKSCTTLNARLNSEHLRGLLFPVTIPSLGMNQSPFVCEVLNFDRRIDVVTQKIGEILNLKQAFESNNYSNSKFFAIGNEPMKKDRENHKIWCDLKESKLIQIVPEDEKKLVVEYTIEHNVRPWEEK